MEQARGKTRRITVGHVAIGGGAPVSIQSMTNTRTADAVATLRQVRELAAEGCDIVRLAVPDMDAVRGFGLACEGSPVPLVADIHFDYRLAIEAAAAGAAKIRINPGNIGGTERVRAVADACRARGIPIRIGVNSGSVERELLERYNGPAPEAMVESALAHCALLERCDFNDICIAVKASDPAAAMSAYLQISERSPYPLHLGVTESGTRAMGTLKSAVCIGGLLAMGIGDTIRVSLSDDPVYEVRAAKDILRAVGLRRDGINLIACPTCGRCRVNLIAIAGEVERRLAEVRAPLSVAVMGCAVNGPGEAKEADIGIAGGSGEMLLFRKGEVVGKLAEETCVDVLCEEVLRMAEAMA